MACCLEVPGQLLSYELAGLGCAECARPGSAHNVASTRVSAIRRVVRAADDDEASARRCYWNLSRAVQQRQVIAGTCGST
jgi:hypothetical protein